jgi:hypothetical protein
MLGRIFFLACFLFFRKVAGLAENLIFIQKASVAFADRQKTLFSFKKP